MNKILDLVVSAERYFDTDRMERKYKHLPSYDFILSYCKNHGITTRNVGGSYFDWECNLTYEQVLDILRIKYAQFYTGVARD